MALLGGIRILNDDEYTLLGATFADKKCGFASTSSTIHAVRTLAYEAVIEAVEE